MAGKKKKAPPAEGGIKIIAQNKKARFNFELMERFECGIVLTGTEVKSLRAGRVSLVDGYGKVENGEVFLVDANIAQYEFGNRQNHEPTRPRKLLMHRAQIDKIAGKIAERGWTLVPIKLYFKKGKVKAEIALARGKQVHDKRETIKRRDQDRDLARQMKDY